jgi:zinc transport system permease protein
MGPVYDHIAELARQGILPPVFAHAFLVRGLIAALLVSPLLGGMSHLVVTRRLAFFSAALGQAALTGLTLGLVLGEPIGQAYGGTFGFCLLAGLAMVWVRRRSRLAPDTLVGVFLALTLGMGICLLVAVTQRFDIHQIEAVMFGSLLTVTDADLAVLAVVGLGVGAALAFCYNDLLFGSVDAPLAESAGVRTGRLEYLFVALLTLAIVASLKIVGALLVEAMVVVPAAAAKNLAGSMRGYLAWSVAVAAAGAAGGWALSVRFPVPPGGAIVLALGALFFLTLGIGWVRERRGGGG